MLFIDVGVKNSKLCLKSYAIKGSILGHQYKLRVKDLHKDCQIKYEMIMAYCRRDKEEQWSVI